MRIVCLCLSHLKLCSVFATVRSYLSLHGICCRYVSVSTFSLFLSTFIVFLKHETKTYSLCAMLRTSKRILQSAKG